MTISSLVDRSIFSILYWSIDYAIRQIVWLNFKENQLGILFCLVILCCIICFKPLMRHNKLATSNFLVASCIIFITNNWSKSFQISAFNLIFSNYLFLLYKNGEKISIDWYIIEHKYILLVLLLLLIWMIWSIEV